MSAGNSPELYVGTEEIALGNLEDQHGRQVNYLRVSITDRCNLRCFYCAPHGSPNLLERSGLLSYEEILRVIRVSAAMGIFKVRFTGGEPLVRRGVCDLVKAATRVPGIEDISMTTNGVLLKEMARPLYDAGLRRINVSLDSTNPEKFKAITGRDLFHVVLEGISEAEEVGFHPIRINVVVMRGVNDDDLGDFARMSAEKPYSIRFIEYMPIGDSPAHDVSAFISTTEIKRHLENFGSLLPVQRTALDGPSQRFRYAMGRGEIGLIGAMSSHFCHSCNRLRLTSDGKIRPCLFSEGELDVKQLLRTGGSDSQIAGMLLKAVAQKPESRKAETADRSINRRGMSAIGG